MFFGLNEACKQNIVMIDNQLFSNRSNLLIDCSDNKGKLISTMNIFIITTSKKTHRLCHRYGDVASCGRRRYQLGSCVDITGLEGKW